MTKDGLVCVPEERSPRMSRALVMGLVLYTSAAIVLGTAAVDLIAPLPKPTLIGAELEEDRALRDHARLLDGTLAQLIESDYRITSRVRSALGAPYSRFLFRHLREGSDKVLQGDDGWLFLVDRLGGQGQDVTGLAGRSSATEAATSRRLHGFGIRHVLVPIPRKAVIGEDKLPYGVAATAELDRVIASAMEARGVETVDLLTPFEQWDGLPLYKSMDSHWSDRGILLAGEITASKIGLRLPEDERGTRIELRPPPSAPPGGDLLELLGIELDESDQDRYPPSNPERVGFSKNGEAASQESVSPRSPLVLCGTSFSASSFPYVLNQFTGLKVLNYSLKGGSSFQSITRALTESPRLAPPSILLQEIPNHVLFDYSLESGRWKVPPYAAEFFASFPPRGLSALPLGADLMAGLTKLGEEFPVAGTRKIAELGSDWLVHSGDGVAELELECAISKGPARLSIDTGTTRCVIPLKTGQNRFVIPLLTETAGPAPLRVVLTSPDRTMVRITQLRLVSTLDGSSAKRMQAGEILVDEASGRWSQTLDLPPGTELERFAAVAIPTDELHGGATDLAIQLHADGARQDFTFGSLRAGGLIVLSPSELSGSHLQRVVVTGSLPAPTAFARGASLLSPAK